MGQTDSAGSLTWNGTQHEQLSRNTGQLLILYPRLYYSPTRTTMNVEKYLSTLYPSEVAGATIFIFQN